MATEIPAGELLKLKEWSSHFGDVGRFVGVCRLIAAGRSVAGAASELDMSPATARSAMLAVASLRNMANQKDIYTATVGRKRKRASALPVVLTPAATQLYLDLRRTLESFSKEDPQLATGPGRPFLRVAVGEGLFSNSILTGHVAETPATATQAKPLRLLMDRKSLNAALDKPPTDAFDMAIVWSGSRRDTARRHWTSHVFEQRTFQLLLIFSSRSQRDRICDWMAGRDGFEWRVDAEKLKGTDLVLSSPESFPAVDRWLAKFGPLHVRKADSFGQVFSQVVSGEANCGLVVDYYPLLDLFNASDVIHYAKLPATVDIEAACRLELLTPRNPGPGQSPDMYLPFFTSLGDDLLDLRKSFDETPTGRLPPATQLPKRASDYEGDFYCAFLESINRSGDQADHWYREVLHLNAIEAKPTRARSPNSASGPVGRRSTEALRHPAIPPISDTIGAHKAYFADGSRIVNDRKEYFRVSGGVFGRHMLYLLADYDPNVDVDSLLGGWAFLRKFLENPSVRNNTNLNRKQAPASFMAYFPYYRESKGRDGLRKIWSGFWLGLNELTHPLANGMVISNRYLTDDDLRSPLKNMRLRFRMAGAGVAGQLERS